MSHAGSPPATQSPPLPREALPRGATIGRYFILRKLGEGGMGVVYAAFDPELDRKIALKVLRPARSMAKGAVAQARLLREAQAMARISHPHVVAVHDVGAHGDDVFVAMELVEGGTLNDWVELKPRRLDELLWAFVQAGRGLAAAHEAGLVHRDFKPENVLMGTDGRVRVTDFGLARMDEPGTAQEPPPAFSSPSLTQDGAIVGTPLFMPPEQAQGLVPDARSDQYGFCATLHWAIYGQPPPSPFYSDQSVDTADGNTPLEVHKDVMSGARQVVLPREPKVPSNVRRVLLRGLAWDATQRFASMDDLLAELAPRRRQATWRIALLGGVLAVVLAVLVTSRISHQPAGLCTGAEQRLAGKWDDAARAAVRASFAAADPASGQEMAGRAVAILDRYAQEWAATRAEACAATRLRGEQTEAVLSLRMSCLDRRLHQLYVLGDLFRSADGRLVQSSVDAALGLPPLSSCDASAQSASARLPGDPQARTKIDAVGRQVDESLALHSAGRFKAALELAEKSSRAASQLEYWPLRAESLGAHGLTLASSGAHREAEQVLLKALLAADIAGSGVEKVWALTRLMYVDGCGLGKFSEAQFYAEAARPLLESLGHDELEFEFRLQLAAMFTCQGRAEQAVEAYQRALELVDRAKGPNAPSRGMLLSNMADRYTALGRFQEALPLLRQALEILSATKGAGHPDVAYVHYNMSEVLRRLGDNAGAYQSIQDAIQIRIRGLGPDHPLVADALDGLAVTLLTDGLHAEAKMESERSLAIREKVLGADHPDVTYSLENLGAALIGMHEPEEAIPVLERAISIRSRNGADAASLAEPRFSLARALWDTRRGRDHERARRLAAAARDGYLQSGQGNEAEEVSQWIATH